MGLLDRLKKKEPPTQEEQASNQPLDLMTTLDLRDMQRVLPPGLEVSPHHLKLHDKLVTCLICTTWPTTLHDLRMLDLLGQKNQIVTYDLRLLNSATVLEDVNRSIQEVESRTAITSRTSDMMENGYEYADLLQLHEALSRGAESMLEVTLRIFVIADSVEGLNEKVSQVTLEAKSKLNMKLVPTSYEMSGNYESLAREANTLGQPIPLYDTFSRQYMFAFQNHADERGVYFGSTPSGGKIILDLFEIKGVRTAFDALYVGGKGAGKSAAMSAMCQDHLAKGNRLMALDVEGVMGAMAELMGGVVISGMGGRNKINPLQLSIVTEAEVKQTDDPAAVEKAQISAARTNFTTEITRIITFYSQLIRTMDSNMESLLSKALETTFRIKGIQPETDLSVLEDRDFPIMTDLYRELGNMLYEQNVVMDDAYQFHGTLRSNLMEDKKSALSLLIDQTYTMAYGVYADMFNGYTNVDMDHTNFIVFDVSQLINSESRSTDAQLFNILTYMWQDVYKNRQRNKNALMTKQRIFSVCMLDEAHRFLNGQNLRVLDFIGKMVRQARKYDAGLWFASQSIQDFFPSSNPGIKDRIIAIFSNVQYKIVMKQDASQLTLLHEAFPQFSESELSQTPAFAAGDMLLSMGGGQNYTCRRYIPTEDLALFGGGREIV